MRRIETRYCTAREAAEALGISRATLYAYTSRGQVQSEPTPGKPRERRYLREDVERLKERKAFRRDPSQAAARGLHWGNPVLPSAITLIHEGQLYYRGHDVRRLAATVTLEQLATLLWVAEPSEQNGLFEQPPVLSAHHFSRLRACTNDPLTLMQMSLPLAGADDLAAYDLRPGAMRQAGARILLLFASLIAGYRAAIPLHEILQSAWGPGRRRVADVIRTALVVSADHELNASTFVSRCAASAGATAYDVVSAGLATLKGRRHGGESDRVSTVFSEAGSPGKITPLAAARAAIAHRLRQGDHIPGFGHPLYPDGDPRAILLLRLAQQSGNKKEWQIVESLRRAGRALLNLSPNLDFGLVAITRTYGLPVYAPLILFALGRTVGWIAHAIEQQAGGEMIRPRARYTGPAPVD